MLQEKYNAALVDKYGNDIFFNPSFDGQLWYDAIGRLPAQVFIGLGVG